MALGLLHVYEQNTGYSASYEVHSQGDVKQVKDKCESCTIKGIEPDRQMKIEDF
ncbi:hypothetical protein ACP4OV_009354 [Aristida adscensionis]